MTDEAAAAEMGEALRRPNQLDGPAAGYLFSRFQGLSGRELFAAGPRATRFMMRSATRALRGEDRLAAPDIPTRVPTLGTAFGVWADELMLAYMATTRLSRQSEYGRISDEVEVALDRLETAGALADPRSFHTRPVDPEPAFDLGSYRGLRYEHMQFPSEHAPPVELPGLDRWRSSAGNRTGHAYVVRHREPRPWIVTLHGFGMGNPSDLAALRARRFFFDLGLNVVQPVFPGHGPRRVEGGPEAFAMDYLDNVHGISQSIAEIRQIISWIQHVQPGVGRVAVHGVSMGGMLAALLAGVDDRLGCVISGVPSVDLAWVFGRHMPDDDRLAADAHRLLGERSERLHSVVSPLAVDPFVPVERRFVYAGVADRMATPGQAHRLWHHWDQPAVRWYRGAHISFAWSAEVRRFVDGALSACGYEHREDQR